MKKLIILLMILLPISIKAQKDSIKVSFSEEKIASFEKTTLIDEYEKAFGNNRVVKTALRIGFNRGLNFDVSPNYSLAVPRTLFPWGAVLNATNPIIQIEQKIFIDKSLIGSFSGNKNKQSLIWQANIGLEGRWYFRMKKRVKAEKQHPNITGEYISLRYDWSPTKLNSEYLTQHGIGSITMFMFQPVSTYSFNWGWQFGNNLNYGFSVGVKQGNKSIIDDRGNWIDIYHSAKKSNNWFISTNVLAGVGLYLPFKKKTTNNYCEFLKCNYEVKQLLKINLNNVLYLDSYNQRASLDMAYERKLGRSPFSLNSNMLVGFDNNIFYLNIGYRQDTSFTDTGQIKEITNSPIYYPKADNYFTYYFQFAEQIRHYIGMNERITKGKSASNLSGFYIGVSGIYRSEATNGMKTNRLGMGLGIGYQIQTNRKSFMDISTGLVRQKLSLPDFRIRGKESIFDFSIKLGFAK